MSLINVDEKQLINAITQSIDNLVETKVNSKSKELVKAEYLNTRNSAKFIGVSEPTFNQLVLEHNIRPSQVFSRKYYCVRELRELMEQLKY